jgi:lipid-A-disaccharide synthase
VKRIFVSAGEPSGDAHAAAVVRALRALAPDVAVDGVGGPHLEAAGATLMARMEHLSAMGLAEALHTAPRHLALLRRLARRFAAARYDAVVLVDYPGFHLRLARAAARRGTPVVYYIAPQLWAWGPWRVTALRRRVARLAVILPFEQPFFAARGVPTTFVGHPLLDRAAAPTRDAARRALGLSSGATVLALCPGSRPTETRRLWPAFRAAAHRLRRAVGDLEVVVLEAACGIRQREDSFRYWRGDPGVLLAAADAGLCKSGTTTLEAALAGMPMVVGYRLSAASYAVARRLVRVPYIGLVNLIAGREVSPELLQDRAGPTALAQAALPLLDRAGPEARRQRAGFETVRAALGTPGAASRVARLVTEAAA